MTPASSPDVTTDPVPDLSGTFAMFDTREGIVFVIRFAGRDREMRWDVPPLLARRARHMIARFLAEGS
jgi:hypothetical protein